MKLSDKQRYLSYAVFVERVLDKFDSCEAFDGDERPFSYLSPFGGLNTKLLLDLICDGEFDKGIDLVDEDKRSNEENEKQLSDDERLSDEEREYCLMAYDTLIKVIEIMR